MIYAEEDINFLNLTDNQFEELCYELLDKMGYKNLVWRQGGADSGRDIEGYLTVENSLVGSRDEKWFFECKRYTAGVPAEQLNSKIAWADAEKPKHLVFLISPYLSNSTRTWLEKISANKPYAVHIVEGKQLKQTILSHPELLAKYFSNPFGKLLLDAQTNWLEHGLIPHDDLLDVVATNLRPSKLTLGDLAFICCVALTNTSNYLNECFCRLAELANSDEPLFSQDYIPNSGAWQNIESKVAGIRLVTSKPTIMYGLVSIDGERGMEILVKAENNLPTKVRYIPTKIKDELGHMVKQNLFPFLTREK